MAALQTVLDATTDMKNRADMKIPVIDIGPYLAGEIGALAASARAIAIASETLGFYFLGNHGIAQSLIDRVFAETQRFHELPLAKKLEVQAIGKVIGYLPLGGQTQNTSIYGKSTTYPDASASFYIKREFAPDHRIASRRSPGSRTIAGRRTCPASARLVSNISTR